MKMNKRMNKILYVYIQVKIIMIEIKKNQSYNRMIVFKTILITIEMIFNNYRNLMAYNYKRILLLIMILIIYNKSFHKLTTKKYLTFLTIKIENNNNNHSSSYNINKMMNKNNNIKIKIINCDYVNK